MAILNAEKDDNKILAALALAMVDHPRASLQELAKAIGISKATLYRFCRTRDELIERLMAHSIACVNEAILTAELETAPPLEALRRLFVNNLEHREVTAFLMYYWKLDGTVADPCAEAAWDATMDAFFLRGQQAGVFRIDIPALALTEIWVSIMTGLVEAERRGRVARAGLADLMEQAFLYGAAVK